MQPEPNKLPLTHSQKPLFYAQQRTPSSAALNMALLFYIDGRIDPLIFQNAFVQTISQCDALRLTFGTQNGVPYQTVNDDIVYNIDVLDFSAYEHASKRAQEWAETRCQAVLNLQKRSFECTLIKLSDGRFAWYLNQHHLITDASASALLYRLVSDNYRKLSDGKLGKMPQPPQYLGEVYNQNQQHQILADAPKLEDKFREEGTSHVEFSRPQFFGQNQQTQSSRSTRTTVTLESETSEALLRILSAQATNENIGLATNPQLLQNTMITLLAALISRSTNQSEFTIGLPIHNRFNLESKETVGVFIKVFPLTITVTPQDSFLTLFNRVKLETIDWLRQIAMGDTDTQQTHSPSIILNCITSEFGTFADNPTTAEWLHPNHIDAAHDMRLQVHNFNHAQQRGGINLSFDFKDDLFSYEQRERTVNYFLSLIDATIKNADKLIAGVKILSPEEITEQQNFNSALSLSREEEPNLLEQFKRQVSRQPSHIALRTGGSSTVTSAQQQSLNYAELDLKSNDFAAALLKQNLTSSLNHNIDTKVIGVGIGSSVDAVVAILGILKSGSAFLPLDLNNPAIRLQSIIEDAQLESIVCNEESLPLLQKIAPHICLLLLNECQQEGSTPESKLPNPKDFVDQPAYVLYTSGSTGIAKGVAVSHKGIASYISWANQVYTQGKDFNYPLFTSLAFDLTLTSLFLPITTGGTLVIYPDQQNQIDTRVLDVAHDNLVDFIKLTPSHLQMLVQKGLSNNSRIKCMVVGGENFKTSLARRTLEQAGGDLDIYNEYGPTEAIVGCMVHRFNIEQDIDTYVPIGKPADKTQLFVYNSALQTAPQGVIGELYIARFGMPDSYWGNAAKEHNHRFITSPHNPDLVIYRTGDRVRFTDTEKLSFVDRSDRQVKISGIRVEPAEIEAAMEAYPAISNAIVIAKQSKKNTPTKRDQAVESFCNNCGMPSNFPGIRMNVDGVCHICQEYDTYKDRVSDYFGDLDQLSAAIRKHAVGDSDYDCIALSSGGKDSTYVLYGLHQLGFKVYALTLDNGYLSEQAKANVVNCTSHLNIPHEMLSTPVMDAIFKDSLARHSNVCDGCFKTLYTMSIAKAKELGINTIVTGLSRGQLFETRLTPSIFKNTKISNSEVDNAVVEARKRYHQIEDEVTNSLDASCISDEIFEQIQILDYYRYCDLSVTNAVDFLTKNTPWCRPVDTGRSTNCRINDVGIYIHQKERGFHNYALPYTWDVRMGHKTREQAINEMQDDINITHVKDILSKIGYDENRLGNEQLAVELNAYYQSDSPLDILELKQHLKNHVGQALIPSKFKRLDKIPLTISGKVDTDRLPDIDEITLALNDEHFFPPTGPAEERIGDIWKEILHIPSICVQTSFFDYGGGSLKAMEAMMQTCQAFGVQLPLSSIFEYPTIQSLARIVEKSILEEISQMSDTQAQNLLNEG